MMNAHRWGFVCLLSCLPISSGVADEIRDQARQLLHKAITSARMLNYEGTFVYTHGRAMDTLRVVHRYGEGGEYERLTCLTGKPSEITRSKGRVHYQFAHKEAFGAYQAEGKANQLISHLSENYDQLTELYEFHPFEGELVAGRATQGFLIQARDHFRYGYQLWLDQDTGLVLKSQLLGSEGPVETLMFTEIRFTNFDEQRSAPGNLQFAAKPNVSVASETVWRPQWMPQGFRLMRSLQHRSKSGGAVSHRVLLSDGMSMITVFIEPLVPNQGPKFASTRQGATAGFSTVTGDHRITAVGEVPPQTVQRIAQSLAIH